MKKLLNLLCLCCLYFISFSQASQQEIAIIPEPVSTIKNTGQFSLPKNVVIESPNQPEMKQVIVFLKERLSIPAGAHVSLTNASPTATIRLVLNKTADATTGKEGYRLSVTPKNIVIKPHQPAGLFYGVQTLMQLFPKEIESTEAVKNVNWIAPCVDITDYPRFGWRGLMFDISRHFFTKNQVKDFIDEMVKYKYNLLQMHFTDDEGWR